MIYLGPIINGQVGLVKQIDGELQHHPEINYHHLLTHTHFLLILTLVKRESIIGSSLAYIHFLLVVKLMVKCILSTERRLILWFLDLAHTLQKTTQLVLKASTLVLEKEHTINMSHKHLQSRVVRQVRVHIARSLE